MDPFALFLASLDVQFPVRDPNACRTCGGLGRVEDDVARRDYQCPDCQPTGESNAPV